MVLILNLNLMKHIFFLLILFSSQILLSQELPRKGWLGARISNENSGGVKVNQVVGGTSLNVGLIMDDVILKINEKSVNSPSDLSKIITNSIEGNSMSFEIIRNGKKITLKGKVKGRDRETIKNGKVIYESISFKGGKLSVIINKPNGEGKKPAILFIPGYTCSSVDGLTENHPYGRIVRAFSDAGFVVVRVEKSGLGDSQNTPDCSSTNLYDEVESFQAGFDKMKSLEYVDKDNLFLFGHSMGGIIAPAISVKNNVKGTIVYGTTAKSWYEYQLEMNRLQLSLAKIPPLEFEEKCRIQSEVAYEYFIQKKSLQEIALNPNKAEVLKSDWMYDGNNMIFDRNQEYWRQIQDYPLLENWKNTSGKVLVLFGEADFQAFSKADHEQIIYTVNYYKPETAKLITFPGTDHYFAKSGSLQNAYSLFENGQILELFDMFDVSVTQKSVEWSKNLIN